MVTTFSFRLGARSAFQSLARYLRENLNRRSFILSYGLFSMTLDTESSPIINYICIGGGFIFCVAIAIFVVKEGLNNQNTLK